MAEYSIYNSQWTAQQIEASIGKNPRIGESGNWEVWNMSTMQYVDTGVLAEGKSISHVDRTSGTGLPGTTDTYTIYDNSETVIGTFDVHNGSDGQGSPGSQTPKMNGTAAVGTANAYSREDHVHPHDDSKADLVDGKVPSGQLPPMDYQPTINVSGILKGDGAGGISAASAGADFAPGRYGLGSKWNTAPSNDADLITGSGFQMANTNVPLSAWWGILSFVYDNSSATQWAIPQNTSSSYFGSVCKREKRGGTWSAWEWVNPPMVAGVEYRTTERHLGKPVYVKAVNCGAISANTRKQVGLGSANVSACIGCYIETEYAAAGTHVLMPFYDPTNTAFGEVMVVTSSGGSTINIHAKGAVLASTAVVKYTKTTD